MVFDGAEALVADDMLDAAGVLRGGLLPHAQGQQGLGQDSMALVDLLRQLIPASVR